MALGFSIQDLWAGNMSEEVLSRAEIFSDALRGSSGVSASQPTTPHGAEFGLLAEPNKAAKQVEDA